MTNYEIIRAYQALEAAQKRQWDELRACAEARRVPGYRQRLLAAIEWHKTHPHGNPGMIPGLEFELSLIPTETKEKARGED